MRVLVVEDSRPLADALVEGLQDEGMAVDVAYDGLQAATRLALNTYDVVILDRDLPGVPGDTICRIVSERENPVMVLMLTASGTPRTVGPRLTQSSWSRCSSGGRTSVSPAAGTRGPSAVATNETNWLDTARSQQPDPVVYMRIHH